MHLCRLFSNISLQGSLGANIQCHLNNKRSHDHKAKLKSFEIQDMVYLYNPARKRGVTNYVGFPQDPVVTASHADHLCYM